MTTHISVSLTGVGLALRETVLWHFVCEQTATQTQNKGNGCVNHQGGASIQPEIAERAYTHTYTNVTGKAGETLPDESKL